MIKKRLAVLLLVMALVGLAGCAKTDGAEGSGEAKENPGGPAQSTSDAGPEDSGPAEHEPIRILSIKEIRPALLEKLFADGFYWGLGSQRMAWVSSTQVIFVPENGEGRRRVFLYDTQTDTITLLHEFSGPDRLAYGAQIRSNEASAYVFFPGPGLIRGIKVDLAGGAVTEYPLGVYDYEFSSQEASLAYDREGNLAVYDLSAPDTPVLLIPASEIGPLGTPSWSPDGEYILITQEADRSPGSATQYKIFDLQGALRFHMEAERGPQEDKGLQWNPDGKGVLIHEVKEDGVTYSFFDLESGRQRELLTLDQNPAGGQVICVTRDYAIVYSFQSSGLRMTDFGQQTTTDISGQQWTDLDIPLPSGVNIPMVYPSQDGKSILLACDGADAESQDLYYVMELR